MNGDKKTPNFGFGEPDDCDIFRRQYARLIQRARSAGEVLLVRKRELAEAQLRRRRAQQQNQSVSPDYSGGTPSPRVDRPWYRNLTPQLTALQGIGDALAAYSDAASEDAERAAERNVERAEEIFDDLRRSAEAEALRLDRLGCRYTAVDSLLRRYF